MQSAKEYLESIEIMQAKLQNLQEEKAELQAKIYGLQSPSAGERVQTSVDPDKMTGKVISLEEMDSIIKRNIEILSNARCDAVNLINQMPNALYVRILYKRYLELKPWRKIAEELCYSKNYIAAERNKALEMFEMINYDFLEKWKNGKKRNQS